MSPILTASTLHHTQQKFLTHLGLTPIVDGDQITVVLGDKPHTYKSGKDLVAALKALDKTGELTRLVSSNPADRSKSGMVYRRYKRAYKPFDGNCGDELAVMLREATRVVPKNKDEEPYTDNKAVTAIAKENDLIARGKNVGHRLMNLSNMLRARLRRGETVTIQSDKVEGIKVHPPGKHAPRAKAAKSTKAAKAE